MVVVPVLRTQQSFANTARVCVQFGQKPQSSRCSGSRAYTVKRVRVRARVRGRGRGRVPGWSKAVKVATLAQAAGSAKCCHRLPGN